MQRKEKQTATYTNLDAIALHELCMHLADSHTCRHLKLNGITWDAAASINFSAMLVSNYGLKTIEIDDAPDESSQELILSGLNRNFDILSFKMTCSPENERKIKRIQERNFQFRIAQRLLLDKLLASINLHTDRIDDIFADIAIINHSQATADEVSEVLFHACMRSQFEYPEISASIQTVITTLKKLKTAGIKNDVSALQAAAVMNMPDYVRGLIAGGADVNLPNHLGQTPLLAAAAYGHFEIVKLLREGGADTSLKDHTGADAFQVALSNRWHDIAAYLQPDATPLVRHRIVSQRNLIIGFNPKLFQSLPEFDSTNIRSYGGGNREGFALIADYLERFSERHDDDTNIKHIAAHFRTAVDTIMLSAPEKLKILNTKGILHTMTGCIEHVAGITITRLADQHYQLTLSDRGLFSATALSFSRDGTSKKLPCLRSIHIPKQHILDILMLLEQATMENGQAAKMILFSDIPQLVNTAWQHHTDSQHSQLKSGVCFFGNIKPLLRHEFQKSYEADTGFQKYKDFTRFLREELLHDYAQYTEGDDPFLFIANKRLEEKYTITKPGTMT